MPRRPALLALLLIVAGCTDPAPPPSAPKITAKTARLDHQTITSGLPLTALETTKSGNGRLKQRWQITGVSPHSSFEIIGNDQSDADTVAWNCREFDPSGNAIKPYSTRCLQVFQAVLGKLITSPEQAALNLLQEGATIAPRTAILQVGDLSIETDGEFYFIRRLSRL